MNAAQRAARAIRVKELLASGMTRAQVANETGLSLWIVSQIVRRDGIQALHGLRKVSDVRADLMRSMYSSGCTLQQIGDEFGITRERVRQLITKYHGRQRAAGGQSVISKRDANKRRAARDARYLEKYGCTFDQWCAVAEAGRDLMANGISRDRTPLGAFMRQRCTAAKRGIAWDLKFWDWWQFWLQSGKWEVRGRGQGYCMCRIGDAGPYALGNIYIASNPDNLRAYYRRKRLEAA